VRRGHGAPEVSLADGYWSVLVGEAAEASARSGQPVDLRDAPDLVGLTDPARSSRRIGQGV
jgi:hypothetical protein